jgi:hypothetical protein
MNPPMMSLPRVIARLECETLAILLTRYEHSIYSDRGGLELPKMTISERKIYSNEL